ncbi:MAG TPA: tetratricopeptide repeat protein [Chitinophagaceae bacterium]|nr:tetratricopeptide repeat protein [Chitinophagaceae bacterium]
MRSLSFFCCIAACAAMLSCNSSSKAPSSEAIQALNLKKGSIIWCGPSGGNFGSVDFMVSASPEVKKDFDQAIAMLHSFEYDEAEKAFAAIIDKDPSCAMAYWGVAMSNFHPLWTPPNEAELKKGSKAVEAARSISDKTKRETEYIEAIGAFYDGHDKLDHKTRCLNYEKAMEKMYATYPADKEAAIFYALALNTTASPTDKTYANQKKAGDILNKIYGGEPNHPGIVHYIIHNYDNPDLAELALPAARKYAAVAPASAHAQHMPSHIFTRLGLWDEAVKSNLASVNSAKCYAESAGIKGTWDEELHGMDYLVYAYLQQGDNERAKQQWDYLRSIQKVSDNNFKVAYAYAAIPSRYVLENRQWKEAAQLELHPASFPWDKFIWQKGIVHFARLMGMAHTNNLAGANNELNTLKNIRDKLLEQKDQYKADQVEVQIKTGEAWIALKKGDQARALELMQQAAALEDATEKHPVTPGEVLPAREMLADMYLALQQPDKALETYEQDMKRHPNRFNGVYGAGLAAEKSGNLQKAEQYYTQLRTIGTGKGRPELSAAQKFLGGAQAKR